jgi:MoaA/NifB/PqqE/SkfB family radical SAM enzyme
VKDLTLECVMQILDAAHAAGAAGLTWAGGEPLMWPHIVDGIKHAKGLGYRQYLLSNGAFLTDEIIQAVKDAEVMIGICVHCDEPAIHDAITGVAGSHQKAVESVRRAVAAGLKVCAGQVVTDENRGRACETYRFIESLGVMGVTFDRVRSVGNGKVLAAQGLLAGAAFGEPCASCVETNVAVATDGTLYPCALGRDNPFGNVFEADIVAAMKSVPHKRVVAQVQEVIQQHPQVDEPYPELDELLGAAARMGAACGSIVCPLSLRGCCRTPRFSSCTR